MGTIDHLTYLKDFLEEHQELSTPLRVVFGNNGQKVVVGKDKLGLIMVNNHHIKLHMYIMYLEWQST